MRHISVISVLYLMAVWLFTSCDSSNVVNESEAKNPSSWMTLQRAYPHQQIDHDAIAVAHKHFANRESQRSAYDESWSYLGPDNIGGRITDIEMPDDDLRTIYAGSASGGIFRSQDQGLSWRIIFDNQASLAIGDIDIYRQDPSIIYVGTGEANGGGGSLAYDGAGVFKSSDAGQSWRSIGLEGVGSIGQIKIHPTDPDIVYVAAMGRLFSSGPDRGVYRTRDGGQSWEQVLYVNDSVGAIDLAIHPTNPDRIWAATWERSRVPNNLRYGGDGSNIYRSDDGGDNWAVMDQGLPRLPEEKGRIALAVSQSDPERVYAFIARQDGNIQGYYESVDGGTSWDLLASDGVIDVPFMWWFGEIAVDPTDADRVFLAGLEIYERNPINGDWLQAFQGAHVDQHSIFIHPLDRDLVIIGNDGGVYISHDGGRNYVKPGGLPNIQFYTCEIDQSQPERVYGGTQDNGTLCSSGGGVNDWRAISGGDGMTVLVDPVDNLIIYTMSQNGFIRRSFDGGDNFITATRGLFGRFNWNSPLEMDPSNSARLYFGGNILYESTFGEEWIPISEDMSNGPYEGNRTFGTITSISVSPLDPNIIYTGTDDGNVWVTLDRGSTWDIISQSLPDRWVTSVEADHSVRSRVFVSYSGYRFGEDIGHVYRSDDFGSSWTNINGDLPDLPVNDIQLHPTRDEVYLATDLGVYYADHLGLEWRLLGQGMPRVPVTSLDHHDNLDFLIAATYGRSMYKYDFDFEVATEEPESERMGISPNPVMTGDQLQISGAEAGQLIYFYSPSGQMIRELSIDESGRVNIPGDISSGVYRARVGRQCLPVVVKN